VHAEREKHLRDGTSTRVGKYMNTPKTTPAKLPGSVVAAGQRLDPLGANDLAGDADREHPTTSKGRSAARTCRTRRARLGLLGRPGARAARPATPTRPRPTPTNGP